MQYVNALSPPIAGERVGVKGWGGNWHLLEAYSTKPTCKPPKYDVQFLRSQALRSSSSSSSSSSRTWQIKECYIGNEAFILLYKRLVRAHLEYINSVWAPYKRCDIEKLEKVQKLATKMLPGLRMMPYPERSKN